MPIIHPAVIRQRPSRPGWLGNSGFSLLELTMTLATGNTFQVASEAVSGGTCATTFTNVGGADPFGSPAVVLNQNVTLQFKPSGFVQATTGTTTFTLSYGSTTKTVTVSNYGNINVTP